MTKKTIEKATFAGGCFWCMVQPFDELPGIIKVESGYMGGHVENPTYKDVKTGESGHYEVVQITFDSSVFAYEKLLSLYWPQIDPTDDGGQFQDRGPQYRTAIFYHNEQQRVEAERSKENVEKSGRFKNPIVTEIMEASVFYLAEDYHQDFYKKSPKEYKLDRQKSGRDEFIDSNWRD
ncbi:peptide-methionine (S)-S-oxide reductase MsrA [Halalkalibacter akibai]|uniref:Peptide methionine sulfoxide reductase MsrA n=1 Tax=Halalkalibacter akibai (strain ATCC 43226 / DSM 21942 / CIP 109018 / JCM 9157 / 1139) TaxID=1236973 RepID=W4QVU7_HALA3|nr:peptide-methionine (S)-S-oxide reductase MsrA [Halalkalibacter akibai]GAE35758.1 peptide methionine sulfoxide reductase MsrA [Halalkalibacter akibai JCM 9157]